MAIIRRKAVALGDVERSEKGIIAFPRFYIKAVTGHYSIYHRLTHGYMCSCNSEEELLVKLREMESMTEEELWRFMGKNIYVLNSAVAQFKIKNQADDNESWYFGAWGTYTTKFYEKYPELMNEVKTVPLDVINKIRMEIAERERKAHAKHMEEIEAKELEYKTGKIVMPKLALPTIEEEPEEQEPEPEEEQEVIVPPIKKKKPVIIKKKKAVTEVKPLGFNF